MLKFVDGMDPEIVNIVFPVEISVVFILVHVGEGGVGGIEEV